MREVRPESPAVVQSTPFHTIPSLAAVFNKSTRVNAEGHATECRVGYSPIVVSRAVLELAGVSALLWRWQVGEPKTC